jgi:hypothetical protein
MTPTWTEQEIVVYGEDEESSAKSLPLGPCHQVVESDADFADSGVSYDHFLRTSPRT